MDTASLAIFLIATVSLNLTPGPDMLYVVARSLGQGRTAGVVSALGIGVGILFHTTAAALGLSALLISVPLAYDLVRYVGAAYLAYLGVRILLSKQDTLPSAQLARQPLWRIFRQGVVTNVLNPKVAVFFLAFLPQFANPAHGPIGWQIALLGLIFDVSGTLVNIGVALAAGYFANRLRGRAVFSRVQRWFTGGIFIALAARLALLERR